MTQDKDKLRSLEKEVRRGNDVQLARIKSLETLITHKAYDSRPKDDDTRTKIAIWFTLGFFALLVFTLILVPLYNGVLAWRGAIDSQLNIRDMFTMVASVVGTPYGMVLGYYFKGIEKK